ncbi:hypothetical protein ESCO_005720 [Escovopsis weberi]|uniref:Pre-mRNA-splicing factor 38B n=1 Tax=Escovopsis weberi TaxID=150374 RepID=A0A0M9VUS1_ESCWE|nr:hypothetical protein ESCO_005720 [Escovopsis weberi]
MQNDVLLTDDYVADLLVKEAGDRSLRYSAMGLEAFNAKPKPSNAPKPNTKFLRHIIKDTDTHNKALLAKEAAESRARLQDLERSEDARRRRTIPRSGEIRRRQLGDIQSILGGRRRRSVGDKDEENERNAREARGEREGGSRRSHRSDGDLVGGYNNTKERRSYGRLSRGQQDGTGIDRKGSARNHPRKGRSTDAGTGTGTDIGTAHEDGDGESCARLRATSPSSSDSDPLDDLIGPAPPPKYRGRGRVAGAAGMDMRFSAAYDPRADVAPAAEEQGGAGWEDAMEAYRDRQKLRQHQESRMRAAGFGDQQIRRLGAGQRQGQGQGERERTEEDVVWAKAGEEREWDRGKGGNDGLRGIFSEDR